MLLIRQSTHIIAGIWLICQGARAYAIAPLRQNKVVQSRIFFVQVETIIIRMMAVSNIVFFIIGDDKTRIVTKSSNKTIALW
ncbi:MAG TPA: hypothetical protein DCY10_00310 [Clostridiales bacterium]|nr:hypothetical protein [Clostridiales bacterium]